MKNLILMFIFLIGSFALHASYRTATLDTVSESVIVDVGDDYNYNLQVDAIVYLDISQSVSYQVGYAQKKASCLLRKGFAHDYFKISGTEVIRYAANAGKFINNTTGGLIFKSKERTTIRAEDLI